MTDPEEIVMVFSEHGNAIDAFPYDPETLIEKAAELRGSITYHDPLGIVTDFTSSLSVSECG